MNLTYERIAELVYERVKNPKSVLPQELGLSFTEPKLNEIDIIKKVFSKYEVSGDTLTIGISPLDYWV